MLPRPTVDRIVHDVEGLVARASTDLEGKGLKMPSMLGGLIRTWFTTAYQAGIEAQREVIVLELQQSPEGRALLERHGFRRRA